VQLFFTLGWAFLLSAATVFYRDVPMIMDVLMLAWFFLTPIFYPISILPQSHTLLGLTLNIQRLAYILNPMASLVASYRVILYYGAPPAWDFLLRTIVTALAFLVLGYLFFARHSWTFAEEV
jgi:ABC-type polysaccharide/polyol phosphate export permease